MSTRVAFAQQSRHARQTWSLLASKTSEPLRRSTEHHRCEQNSQNTAVVMNSRSSPTSQVPTIHCELSCHRASSDATLRYENPSH